MSEKYIKEKINKAFDRASLSIPEKISDLRLHPIRLIDSIKSLIGIDLDNNNDRFISMIDSIAENGNTEIDSNNQIAYVPSEVVSFIDLEISIIDRDLDSSKKLIDDLLIVADNKHIVEFLIELSLKQSGESFLFIWSIYKILLFIDFDNSSKWLHLAVTAACLDRFNDFPENDKAIDFADSVKVKDINDFDIISKLFQLSKTDFVRKDRMLKSAMILLVNYVLPKKIEYLSNDLSFESQRLMKRKWISDYVNANIDKLSDDDIIYLDSARGIIYLDSNSKLIGAVFTFINQKLNLNDR